MIRPIAILGEVLTLATNALDGLSRATYVLADSVDRWDKWMSVDEEEWKRLQLVDRQLERERARAEEAEGRNADLQDQAMQAGAAAREYARRITELEAELAEERGRSRLTWEDYERLTEFVIRMENAKFQEQRADQAECLQIELRELTDAERKDGAG